MKKFLAVLLVSLTVLSMAFAGGQSESNAKPSVTYWYWEDVQGMMVDLLQERWDAEYGDEITLILEPVPSGEFHDKLITAVSAGNGPDVFETYTEWIPELIGLDALEDLTGKFDDWEYIDQVPENMIELAYAGFDKMYTFPRSVLVMYLYCRPSYFEAAGVDYPTTLDEFYDAAAKLTRDINGDGIVDVYGYGMRGASKGYAAWASFVFSALPDFDYYGEDGKADFSDPAIIEANQRYIDLYKNGWVPPTAVTDDFNQIMQDFKSGVTSMLYHQVSSSKGMVEQFGDDVIAIPLPEGAGGTYGVEEVTNFAIWSGSKNKDAALTFLKWISSPEIQAVICEEMQQVPWVTSVAEMDYFQDDPFFKVSVDSLPDAHLVPVTTQMSDFTNTAWAQNFQRALLGEITGEQMLQNLENVLNGN